MDGPAVLLARGKFNVELLCWLLLLWVKVNVRILVHDVVLFLVGDFKPWIQYSVKLLSWCIVIMQTKISVILNCQSCLILLCYLTFKTFSTQGHGIMYVNDMNCLWGEGSNVGYGYTSCIVHYQDVGWSRLSVSMTFFFSFLFLSVLEGKEFGWRIFHISVMLITSVFVRMKFDVNQIPRLWWNGVKMLL